METDPARTTTASLLSGSMHGLRNNIATLRSASRLIDDADIADALRSATSELHVAIERAAALARIESASTRARDVISLDQLLELAAKRAGREGASPSSRIDAAGVDVRVAGSVAERLLTDLMHLSDGTWDVSAVDHPSVTFGAMRPLDPLLISYLTQLADAGGFDIAIESGSVSVKFERPS